MNRSLTNRNRWLVYGAVVVLVLIIAAVGGIWMVRHRVHHMINDKIEQRGWSLNMSGMRVGMLGALHIQKACLSLLDDDHDDICADNIVVHLHMRSILQRKAVIQSVHVDSTQIDSSRTRLNEVRRLRRAPPHDPAVPTKRKRPEIHSIHMDQVDIQLQDGPRRAHVQLRDVQTHLANDGYHARGHGTLQEINLPSTQLEETLNAATGQTFLLKAVIDEHGSPASASLEFQDALRVPLSIADGGDASVSAIAFVAPYTVAIASPSVHLPAMNARASARSVTLQIGIWTMETSQMYVASMTVDSPVIHVPRDRVQDVAQTITQWRQNIGGGQLAEDLEPTDDASTHASETDVSTGNHDNRAHQGRRSIVRRLWRRAFQKRSWWEILPREIRIENATIQMLGKDENALRFEDLNLTYAVRVLRKQMDLEWSGRVNQGERDSGSAHGRFQWHYAKQTALVQWKVEGLRLSLVRSWMAPHASLVVNGLVSSRGHLRSDRVLHMKGHHQMTIDGLQLTHDRFEHAIGFSTVTISGDVGGAPRWLQGSDTDAERRFFVLNAQQVQVGKNRAEVGLQLDDLRLDRHAPFSTAHVSLQVPPQPAMQLWEMIPTALLGPLEGTELSGLWGIDLGFDILRGTDVNSGASVWQILAPHTYTLHDKKLSLVSLPHDVDVRRLNGPMRFVFRGPNDTFMRNMMIPAPPGAQEADGQENDPADRHNWVRLRDMSFYLIATQLYREDGSFFKNSGINWLQIRHVLSDALTTGKVKRGASTITMQTIKNVFLSHEKTAERKLQELFLSYWMTRIVPKERILEIYLNIIELGPDRNGVDEASQFYFGHSIRDLGVRESIWLSAISPNPVLIGGQKQKTREDLDRCKRCDQLAGALHNRGWINDKEYAEGIRKTTDIVEETERSAVDRFEEANPASLPDIFTTDAPDSGLTSSVIFQTPPLFDRLGDQEDEEEDARFERLPTDKRLDAWIEQKRPVVGANARP